MKKALSLLFYLSIIALFPPNAYSNCSCHYTSIETIGTEYVAKRCPGEGDNDNTLMTYAIRDVKCLNDTFVYSNFRESDLTPAGIESYGTWYNSRVLRNPSGTHFIVVHKYFKGKVARIDVTNLPVNVYTYDSLNSYCYTSGDVVDNDGDGWPSCFDCNDNDSNYTSECPLPVVEEKNLVYKPCKYHAYAGNPVNIATGNKYQKETDIAQGSTPMALEFTRHYNSRSTIDRSIGYGWSHTYERYLTFSDGKILSHREDGRVIYFSSDTFEAESGAREKLVHNEDGTYTFKTINRVDELYDSGGNLLSLTDLNGNTVSLTYQDGHLAIVTDPFGRTLTFSYNPSGRIESITDPAGKTIQFAYDSNDNLTLVTYQDGSTREYVYDDPNDVHNLTGIVDENGNRYATFAYDDSDRAILSTHAGDSGCANLKMTRKGVLC